MGRVQEAEADNMGSGIFKGSRNRETSEKISLNAYFLVEIKERGWSWE